MHLTNLEDYFKLSLHIKNDCSVACQAIQSDQNAAIPDGRCETYPFALVLLVETKILRTFHAFFNMWDI